MFISRSKDKGVVTHIHNGLLFDLKSGETLPFATTWTDLVGISLK